MNIECCFQRDMLLSLNAIWRQTALQFFPFAECNWWLVNCNFSRTDPKASRRTFCKLRHDRSKHDDNDVPELIYILVMELGRAAGKLIT